VYILKKEKTSMLITKYLGEVSKWKKKVKIDEVQRNWKRFNSH